MEDLLSQARDLLAIPWVRALIVVVLSIVIGKTLETEFGTKGKDWHWQSGGIVTVGSKATIALHDLTGFD